jgi:GTP-binding protein HflX
VCHRAHKPPVICNLEILISHLDGNLLGLKASQRKALERTFRRRVPTDEVVTLELARHLTAISREIGRQVGVLLSRDGAVRQVVVGDASQLELPDVGRLRGGVGRFRGLRLVHTHLRGEPLTADDLNDLAMLRLDLVAAIQADQQGDPGAIEIAHLDPGAVAADGNGADPFVRVTAAQVHLLDFPFEETIAALEAELARLVSRGVGQGSGERALVIGVSHQAHDFEEVLALVASTDVIVAGTVRKRGGRLNPSTVVGKGKLVEIVLAGMRCGATVAVFDIDLRPAQARGFEDATGLKTVDRTQLILDVFAQRARSRDGKLQVELAQLKYALPRLTEKDAGLSRLAGGIGGRGPGETVLEIGRRRIRDRIHKLEREIDNLSRQRDLRRRQRRRAGVPVLSLIGYTNAGKSSLLNALTESTVEAVDQLFSTLDPTSRRLRFPREGEVIITDTVGFIADLPPDLVTAFRATLEELADADLLLHVVDAADPDVERKLRAVDRLLEELDLAGIPRLLLLNKADLVAPAELVALARRLEALPVSAHSRSGMGELIVAAEARLRRGGAWTVHEWERAPHSSVPPAAG